MWYTYCSTGFPELDRDHAKIDDLLCRAVGAATPAEEHKFLIATYRAVIAHIRVRNLLLGLEKSMQEKEQDRNFTRFVREKIRERSQGLISVQHFASDVRHMLIVHAMTHSREKQAV